MRRTLPLIATLLLLLAACAGEDTDTDATPDEPEATETQDDAAADVDDQPDATATFVTPQDGETVADPVELELAAEGVELVEAGEPAVGEGHLHVMVDIGCVEDGEIIPGPSDEHEEEGFFHLGDGTTERELDLEPGTYELCVQLGDGTHVAFGETETIEITVE
jgi:hypothetical protein